jgi:DNA-binding response OmpR family regulator
MKKKYTLLIYENEIFLNSILKEQFLPFDSYQLVIVTNETKLLEIVNKDFFDLFVFNLEILNNNFSDLVKDFQEFNKHTNIIAYYDKEKSYQEFKKYNIRFLKKPFKFNSLLNYLENIKNNNFSSQNNTYLMGHIQFIPVKKTIYNLNNHLQEHLTEKETYLLDYLNRNRNRNITKVDLLKKIWGVNEDINTHTLETHMYRLKLKLYKVEPNLTFTLVNQNGVFCMKDNC